MRGPNSHLATFGTTGPGKVPIVPEPEYRGRSGASLGFEINYGMAATPWLLLHPGAQYVVNPSGRKDLGDAIVFGLTTGITF